MKVDYDDTNQGHSNFSDTQRELAELQGWLQQQSGDTSALRSGDSSDSIEDMVQSSMSTTEEDVKTQFALSLKTLSQHAGSFESRHDESKTLAACQRKCSRYEDAVIKIKLANADIMKLYEKEKLQLFVNCIKK